MGWVAMSERDMQRIPVLSEVLQGRRTRACAAAVLDVAPRQVRRLLARLRDGGGSAITHRLRGRASNRRIAPEIRAHAVSWSAVTLVSGSLRPVRVIGCRSLGVWQ